MQKNKHLSPTWFLNEPIDYEHKQYVLMDYLQNVRENFGRMILFPQLIELKYQYSNLESFLKSREIIIGSMAKIKAIDLKRMEIVYDFPEDSEEMKEIVSIIQWSLPKIEKTFKEGRFLFAHVEESLEMNYIGVIPEKYINEGFIFVRMGTETTLHIYEYKIRNVLDPHHENKKMLLKKIDSFDFISGDNYENSKMKICERTKQSNPLFLCIESKEIFPLEETLLPVIQRLAIDKINKDYVAKKIKQ
jgi:hypothetical protein